MSTLAGVRGRNREEPATRLFVRRTRWGVPSTIFFCDAGGRLWPAGDPKASNLGGRLLGYSRRGDGALTDGRNRWSAVSKANRTLSLSTEKSLAAIRPIARSGRIHGQNAMHDRHQPYG
jgi:hypothetical protein